MNKLSNYDLKSDWTCLDDWMFNAIKFFLISLKFLFDLMASICIFLFVLWVLKFYFVKIFFHRPFLAGIKLVIKNSDSDREWYEK